MTPVAHRPYFALPEHMFRDAVALEEDDEPLRVSPRRVA